MIKINESNLDRVVRIIVGAAIISLAFWGPQTAWAYLGLIPLITGLVGFCPMYKVFGLSTCPMREAMQKR